MTRPMTVPCLMMPERNQESIPGRRQTIHSRLFSLVACLVFFGSLTLLRLVDLNANFPIENSLLALVISVIAAWWCPRLPLIFIVLVSNITGFSIDLAQKPEVWICIFRYAIRISITLLLICLTFHVKTQLQRARFLARIDSLTGIPNRQAILEALEAEFFRARRFGRPISIAMLDCDDFKQINDKHGHLAGDRVLRCVAEALRKSTRAYDCVGRLGGDEFVIIISEVQTNEVPKVVERMRILLRQELFRDVTSPTFSIGVVTIQFQRNPGDLPVDCLECLRLADEAMYKAKRSGRDQNHFDSIVCDAGSRK